MCLRRAHPFPSALWTRPPARPAVARVSLLGALCQGRILLTELQPRLGCPPSPQEHWGMRWGHSTLQVALMALRSWPASLLPSQQKEKATL